jgi:hypothetical protein
MYNARNNGAGTSDEGEMTFQTFISPENVRHSVKITLFMSGDYYY